MPAFTIPFLAWAATATETTLGILLIVGSATLGGSRQRHLALLVRHRHGDFFWYQDAAGLFRVFRIGRSTVALAHPGPQVCCELTNRGEKMRRIISIPVAIIAGRGLPVPEPGLSC